MRILGGTLISAVVVATAPAGAGDLKPGDRIRLAGPQVEGFSAAGELDAVEGGRLLLRLERSDRILKIDPEALATLEVYRPRQTGAGEGAVIGMAAGGILGGALFWAAGGLSCVGGEPCAGGDMALPGVIFGGLGGSLVGGLIGATVTTRAAGWEPVTVGGKRVQVSLVPQPGLGAGLRVRF
jgi:hypothetical protein